jgi:hypothetical protein
MVAAANQLAKAEEIPDNAPESDIPAEEGTEETSEEEK